MLIWGSPEVKQLRKLILSSYVPQKFKTEGRIFFYSTFILTIIVEILLSYSVYVNDILLKIAVVFSTGFIFYRYQFILHDTSHGTLVPNKRENELLGTLAGLISGYPYTMYKRNHAVHHIYTASKNDYELDNFLDESLKIKINTQFLIKITRSFLLYDFWRLIKSIINIYLNGNRSSNSNSKLNKLFIFLSITIQLILINIFNFELSFVFFANSLFLLILSVGAITFTLNRVRGMCEHSLIEELRYTNYTRTHNKNIFTFLIAPFNFNFHVEHHLFPEISSGNYTKINIELRKTIRNDNWYSKSYMTTIKNYVLCTSKI